MRRLDERAIARQRTSTAPLRGPLALLHALSGSCAGDGLERSPVPARSAESAALPRRRVAPDAFAMNENSASD
ncbi:hypothetical protein BFF94_005850 [Burkholderia catarinensis]|nr:hypothetical protein BFF94_005850 [Burkholderia catarinensis]